MKNNSRINYRSGHDLFFALFTAALLVLCSGGYERAWGAGRGETYVNKDYGFALRLSGGFRLNGEEDGLLLFASATMPGTVAIKNQPGLSAQDVQEAVLTGYQDEGVYLRPAGNGRLVNVSNGRAMAVEVKGTIEGTRVRGLLAGYVGSDGQGIILLVSAPENKWGALSKEADRIVKGVSFIKMEGGGPEVRYWTRRLSGMRLASRSSYGDASGGGSSSEDYYMCSNGTFFSSSSSMDSFDGGGGSGYGYGSGSSSGRWSIQKVQGEVRINITYGDGSRDYAVLTEEDGGTYIDGARYYVVENDQCP